MAPPVTDDALPASTYASVQFGGLAACRRSATAMPLAALVDDFLKRIPAESRAAYIDHTLDHGAQHVQHHLQHVGLSAADLRAVVAQPMTLAMGRLSIEGMGPSVALVIEEGESAAAIGRCMAALENLARQLFAGIVLDDVKIGDLTVRHAAIPDLPPVFTASVGGYFVLTNSRGQLREIADVVRGVQPGLARTSRLADLRRRMPQPALASVFVNAASVSSMLDPHLPYEAAEWGAALGLGQLDALYAGTTASTQGGSDVFHLGLGGSKRGLMKALVAQPADLGFASLCSQNTVVFGAGSFDAPAVLDAFAHLLELLPGPDREQARKGIDRGLRRIGTTREAVEGLVRAFGNQVGFALSLEKGAVPKPEVLLHVAVRDASAVAPVLLQLEAMVAERGQVEWKTRKVGEHEIRFCNIDLGRVELKLSPCYVLTEKALLFGSDTAVLVRALRQGDKPEESFAAQPDFKTLQALSAGGSGVMHLRLFRGVEIGWRTVETMVYPQLDARREWGISSEALPDAESMAKALGTSTFVYNVDDDGITCKSHGTLAFGSLLAGFGALADEVLSRASGKVY
ncbi:MAG TPA: hypothetical protein VFT55_06925 [Planctomycetota bacterium]|nr:hypothetical protein [Planctomycetota bacterium]